MQINKKIVLFNFICRILYLKRFLTSGNFQSLLSARKNLSMKKGMIDFNRQIVSFEALFE